MLVTNLIFDGGQNHGAISKPVIHIVGVLALVVSEVHVRHKPLVILFDDRVDHRSMWGLELPLVISNPGLISQMNEKLLSCVADCRKFRRFDEFGLSMSPGS